MSMKKRIEVTRPSMPPIEEYIDEIKGLWKSRMLTNNGEKHLELEKKLSEYLGVENLCLAVNGHQALECIIDVMGIKGEVITTPFTFASTVNALVRRSLIPVFCDIKADDFTLDPEKIEPLITEKTSAVMPVHVYGSLCDDEKIEKIAQKYSLKVIYDAAHAFGVTKNGVSAASFGDAAMLSFHATKVFNSVEGGAAVFKDKKNKALFEQLKNFGLNKEEPEFFGGNAKMNELSAAMGLCNLRHIEDSISARKRAAMRYRENLADVKGIYIPPEGDGVKSNYAYFPIIVQPEKFGASRDSVIDELSKNGIGARRYFYPLASENKAFGENRNTLKTPNALYASRNVLCLPIYEGLTDEEVDMICKIVRYF